MVTSSNGTDPAPRTPTARRRTVWLHIGLHKTASTFIQETLQSNAQALARQGFLYPRAGRLGAGHALLAYPHLPVQRAAEADVAPHLAAAEGAWAALEEELRSQPAPQDIILSSEYFSLVEDVGALQAACAALGESTRVVVYLRRQDRLLEAGYNQAVKAGLETRPLLLGPVLPERLDWYRLLERWAGPFGRRNVIVRVFEEAVAGPGILSDFCAAVGLDPEPLVPSERRNTRLANELLGYRRVENRLGLVDSRLTQLATRRMRSAGWPDSAVLPAAERRRVVAAFQESNERVAREYLGRTDGRLFDTAGLAGPEEAASESAGVGVALAVAWAELDAELARLRDEVAELRRALERTERRCARPGLRRRLARWLRRVKRPEG
ncbi:MAG TPA: hypothetical protein ENK62_06930 [Chromatiales bacterium]|nr:hypothetical protein [Chromatiales bacterium]